MLLGLTDRLVISVTLVRVVVVFVVIIFGKLFAMAGVIVVWIEVLRVLSFGFDVDVRLHLDVKDGRQCLLVNVAHSMLRISRFDDADVDKVVGLDPQKSYSSL